MGHGASASGRSTHHTLNLVQTSNEEAKQDSGTPTKATASAEGKDGETDKAKSNSPNGKKSPPEGTSPDAKAPAPKLLLAGVSPRTLDAPAAGAGLAARRKPGFNMQVSTAGMNNMDKGQAVEMDQLLKKKKLQIRKIENMSKMYKIEGEVMPSTNTGMEVRHAKRLSDSAAVVIKIRKKSNSFVSAEEEQEWRTSTEMLLNFPPSENICQLYEVLEDHTNYYVVMEKVEGMDLFEWLDSEGRLDTGQAKAILRKLLQAVQALHATGCIHKDIKLENIMVDKSPKSISPSSPKSPAATTLRTLTQNGTSPSSPGSKKRSDSIGFAVEPDPTVKLIDFDTVEEFSPTARAKSVVGTDQYIAQEAYAGHYSPASDIFSVGVIAYRLMSGRFPFKNQMFDDEAGENWVGSPKMKVIQERIRHFHIDWSIPPWPSETHARDLTRWMLSNNEKDRPTAHQALQHAFLAFSGETPHLPQGPFGSRSKNSRQGLPHN